MLIFVLFFFLKIFFENDSIFHSMDVDFCKVCRLKCLIFYYHIDNRKFLTFKKSWRSMLIVFDNLDFNDILEERGIVKYLLAF